MTDRSDFDLERNPDAGKSLVNRFLARDYRNPVVESEIKGVKFHFFEMPGSVSQPGTRCPGQTVRDQPEAQLSTRQSLVRTFKAMQRGEV
ncbi:T6SS amidase immunity protein Tai4 family protein [Burkholderia sp. BE17]|uniref:T6SS amidase immunity protein Tai4 family protein n=1 Tax=Burkholderia sp. BE17 TaxID=2656644 RepID=UPI001D11F683|nr:T6SS amidase immunity protein Tai4 family protein [Burkholderia sp. BE17]